ncbi:MAG TPA: aldo/keto reductase [archaeon]|nr:aldo/keto reductase [archaeon]
MRARQDIRFGSTQLADSITRRDFIRTSSMAAIGAAAALGAGFSSAGGAADRLTVNGLPATVFGRTGLKVTRISFGGILLNDPPVLLHAIDQGMNLVHTSPGYQNGRSIEAFGRIFKTKGIRDKLVLALKARPEKLDEGLKLLNTDYVDFLIPPMDSIHEISDPLLRENFEKAREAGKCGHMGFACHTHTAEILDRTRELGFYDVILMSYASKSPAFLDALQRVREAGIGILAMKGLPKRASENPGEEERSLVSSLCTSMVERYHAHTVLASMASFQAVEMYREILETRLGYHNRMLEDRYWAGQKGNYCAMCGNCSGFCPQGVEISDIVRYRMYYKDYGLTGYARAEYAALNKECSALSCQECGLCEQVCTRQLPLREMLREAHTLLG